jgi:predicted transcriptional regulator
MKVLLSIKPEFAFKIFEGRKKFEFRKVIFKNPNIKTVVVYASSPIQQVIGEFEIDNILSSKPSEIWRQTKKHSGITEEFFYEYFGDREIAHAIKIKNIKKYKQPLNLQDNFNVVPPQSYLYLKNDKTKILKQPIDL